MTGPLAVADVIVVRAHLHNARLVACRATGALVLPTGAFARPLLPLLVAWCGQTQRSTTLRIEGHKHVAPGGCGALGRAAHRPHLAVCELTPRGVQHRHAARPQRRGQRLPRVSGHAREVERVVERERGGSEEVQGAALAECGHCGWGAVEGANSGQGSPRQLALAHQARGGSAQEGQRPVHAMGSLAPWHGPKASCHQPLVGHEGEARDGPAQLDAGQRCALFRVPAPQEAVLARG